ncbi:S-layer homology domain-containing protein [Paenibacillus glycanilyticus]|uniref:S-layer homology domain-containing protein n=1 Tax=Paenibacillus glycanilyticus TaxID=126569 RepID=UPI00203DAF61|nr:S-layer homology domain-containing protein [Paenibacillus glycanilyticus]MCM3627841.1 S-layer homology domain-containing protein [Paenibacillus glycanilyticus]
MSRWKPLLPLLIGCSLLTFAVTGYAATRAAYEEADQSWAAPALKEWLDLGWLQGYLDGTIKPEQSVTRAEMISLLNRAFVLTDTAPLSFQDVTAADWFYTDISKAVKAGYIAGGEGSIKPGQILTREEAALLLASVVHLELPREKKPPFKDKESILEANRGAIATLAEKGIIKGYPDGTFRPNEPVTRASAVVMIDTLLKSGIVNRSYAAPGTYGLESAVETVYGSVTLTAPDITLRDMHIKGNLVIEGGSGDYRLLHVVVEGHTIIRGKGSPALHLTDASLHEVVAQPEEHTFVTTEGDTAITQLTADTPLTLSLSDDTAVELLVLNARADVNGGGTIGHATLNEGAEWSTFEEQPDVIDGPYKSAWIRT